MQHIFNTFNGCFTIIRIADIAYNKAETVWIIFEQRVYVLDVAGREVVETDNLITALKPEAAGTTHPVLLSALVRLLTERGAEVRVGDSPGGVYSKAYVDHVYSVCGLEAVKEAGGSLNEDYGVKECFDLECKILKSFTYTAWLDWADVILSFSKLKVHAMMSMTAATKNLFGVIPGAVKAEYHYRFPEYRDFADMLVDLNVHFKPLLHFCDAVTGMEGNGPTQGTPRHLGALLVSPDPFALDLAAAKLIGLKKEDVPYIQAAYERQLIPAAAEELEIDGDLDAFLVTDFQHVGSVRSLTNLVGGSSPLSRFARRALSRMMQTEPELRAAACVGCGVCARSCPAKAIAILDKKAKIDRSQCIRCFCCQELCPKGAMGVHRPLFARIAGRL